jgi:hypothetical protein
MLGDAGLAIVGGGLASAAAPHPVAFPDVRTNPDTASPAGTIPPVAERVA